MRTPRLFLGIFALALLLPLLLLACGGSDEPTDVPSSERATAEPTDVPNSERATDAPVPATAPPATGPTSAKTDREALVALYNATNGPNWRIDRNWLSNAPLDKWFTVITDHDGRVIGLPLADNNLSGEIPAELGSLSNLRGLYLNDNDLSGEIPAELGSLSNLTVLYLSNIGLSGEIPAELGNLSNLTQLSLSSNDLSGCVPSSLEDQLDFNFSNLGGMLFC